MRSRPALLLLLISFLGCAKSKESVLLRLKYQKGDEQAFTIKVRAYCSESAYINSEISAGFTVDSVVDNGTRYCLSSKINTIKTDIKILDFLSNGFTEYYDSGKEFSAMNDDERALDKQYEAVMLPYYAISFNPEGEIVKPFTLYGKAVDPPFGAAIVQMPFPHGKVKVGDSWSANISNPLFHANDKINALLINFVLTYKIDDITPDKVIIHVDLTENADKRLSSVIKSLNGEGQYIIDRANGSVISGRIDIPQPGCEKAVITVLKK